MTYDGLAASHPPCAVDTSILFQYASYRLSARSAQSHAHAHVIKHRTRSHQSGSMERQRGKHRQRSPLSHPAARGRHVTDQTFPAGLRDASARAVNKLRPMPRAAEAGLLWRARPRARTEGGRCSLATPLSRSHSVAPTREVCGRAGRLYTPRGHGARRAARAGGRAPSEDVERAGGGEVT